MAKRRAVVSVESFIRVAIAERSKYRSIFDAADELGMTPDSLYQKVLTHNRKMCLGANGEVDTTHPAYIEPWANPKASQTGDVGTRSRGVSVESLAALIAKAKASSVAPPAGGSDEATA